MFEHCDYACVHLNRRDIFTKWHNTCGRHYPRTQFVDEAVIEENTGLYCNVVVVLANRSDVHDRKVVLLKSLQQAAYASSRSA